MYVGIKNVEGNYGGTYEDSCELETLDDLVEWYGEQHDVCVMYEVSREIFPSEIRQVQIDRARVEMEQRERAMVAARAVLTSEQLQALGLN